VFDADEFFFSVAALLREPPLFGFDAYANTAIKERRSRRRRDLGFASLERAQKLVAEAVQHLIIQLIFAVFTIHPHIFTSMETQNTSTLFRDIFSTSAATRAGRGANAF
jgi:hypothetical protein